MKKRLLVSLIVGLTVLGLGCRIDVEKYLGSVQVLSSGCTAFSIHEVQGYWMTANHCLLDGPLSTYEILGTPVAVVKADPIADLALLQGSIHAFSLPVAGRAPKEGDRLVVVGYPWPSELPIAQVAKVVSVAREWTDDPFWKHNMILKLAFARAPGTSGSPVLNGDGNVVAVHQGWWIGDDETDGAVSLQSTHADFSQFVKGFTP